MDSSFCSHCQEVNTERLASGFQLPSWPLVSAHRNECSLCSLVWFVCSQRLEDADTELSTGELVLSQTEGEYYSLRRTLPGSFHDRHIAHLRTFSSEDDPSGLFTATPGRPVYPADSYGTIKLVQSWLESCTKNHSNCRRTISGSTVEDVHGNPLPSRVIDVGGESPRLTVSKGRRGRYVALSYCWGSELPSLTCTTAIMEDLMKAIQLSELPRTIREAVIFTKSLGIKFLWVDSLCIVQDNAEDWRQESIRMGKIFQNATCTIAATASTHCDDTLFKPRVLYDGVESLGSTLSRAISIPVSDKKGQTYSTVCLQYVDSSVNVPTPARFDFEQTHSGWVKRAWVVQERLLSRRILHFGMDEVYWECQQTVFAQSTREPIPTDLRLASKPAMFSRLYKETRLGQTIQVKSHNTRTLAAFLGVTRNKLGSMFGSHPGEPVAMRIRFWNRVIEYYNECGLSHKSDKLSAIAGLAEELSTLTSKTYYHGLWLEDIAKGLSWCSECSHGKQGFEHLSLPGVPSWTWAAWSGPLNTASYLADFDPGRARVQARMYEIAKMEGHAQLHLLAYLWPAQQATSNPELAFSRWKTKSWWTLRGFDTPLDDYIPRHVKHSVLHVHPTNNDADNFEALAFFDRDEKDSVFDGLTCVVLHTVSVEHDQTFEKAYGYYFLIVRPNTDNNYIRLGIGIGVSAIDRIPQLFFSRKPPLTPITVV